MPRTREYWAMRFMRLQASQLERSDQLVREMAIIYNRSLRDIEDDINRFYARYATNNQISLSEARRLLTGAELDEFKLSVQEFIRYGQNNTLNPDYKRFLENQSIRVRVSRLEALQLQVRQRIEALMGQQVDMMTDRYTDLVSLSYNRTAYEIARGVRVATPFNQLSNTQIDYIIRKPWAPDGLDFSSRIWGRQRPQLVSTLHTEMTQAFIRGEGPRRLINTVSKRFNTSKFNAARLIQTEASFVTNAANQRAFRTLGVEQYEIIATLDRRTSSICRSLDGQVFDMGEYQPNVTAPPFHPFCRTVIAPFFDDISGERFARDIEGRRITVPGNITYAEYERRFLRPAA